MPTPRTPSARCWPWAEPNATVATQLATSLLAQADASGSAEAQDLLRSAIAADASAPLPRLYLAAELMRIKDFGQAATYWQEAIDLAQGDEPWLVAAQQGLAAAKNDGVDPGAAEQQEMIAGMVSGLADRLASEGGTIEEWTQLVRSYLVLGDVDKAQAAFDEAVIAYPAAFDRGDLDAVALGAGLKLNGAKP
jgi:cytochrome c-type biogenesis protein CcmH